MRQIFPRHPIAPIFGFLSKNRRLKIWYYLLILTSTASFLLLVSPYFRETLGFSQFDPQFNNEKSILMIEIKYDEWAIRKKYVNHNSSITPKLWQRLKPAMTTQEKRTLRILLSEFIKISETQNFTHFMISGTLLGSYRHHGLMPWDDDVDILMRYAQRDQILSYFRNYSKEHDVSVETGNQKRMKLFHKHRSVSVKGYKYRWPTVDISFYDENSTHIWQLYGKKLYNILPKSLIFPLHRRPFELLLINSPYDAFAVLRLLYKDPNCVTLSYVHRTESHPRQVLKFNCEIVSGFYPFVERQLKDGCVQEDLVLNGKILYSVSVDEPIYAITKPYVLKLIKKLELEPSNNISSANTRLIGNNSISVTVSLSSLVESRNESGHQHQDLMTTANHF